MKVREKKPGVMGKGKLDRTTDTVCKNGAGTTFSSSGWDVREPALITGGLRQKEKVTQKGA